MLTSQQLISIYNELTPIWIDSIYELRYDTNGFSLYRQLEGGDFSQTYIPHTIAKLIIASCHPSVEDSIGFWERMVCNELAM